MVDLYVSTSGSDSNAGTRESPFKTIEKASAAATGETTVHVAPGTYEGGITTERDGVTYVSEVKWGAKIVPGAGNDQRDAWINHGDGVTIDGFEVDGGSPHGTPWLYGIHTGGANSTVKNNKVHDLLRDADAMGAASGGQGGAGIMADGWSGGSDMVVTCNTVYNIGPDGEESTLVHGIYMATPGEVRNNVVHDVVGDGITSWHRATALTIAGNTVYGANGAGIMVGGGSQGLNDHSTVRDNHVHDNRKGIEENGNTGPNNTFTHNSVHDNGTDWALQNGRRSTADFATGDDRGEGVDVLLSVGSNDTLAGSIGGNVFSFELHSGLDVVAGPSDEGTGLTGGPDWPARVTGGGEALVAFTPSDTLTQAGIRPGLVNTGLLIGG